MPELPDVETFKRYVNSTSLHQGIRKVEVDAARMLRVAPRRLCKALEGSEFLQTERLGKYLFIRVKGGPWLVLHFGMSGMLEYAKDAGERPAHTHLLVHFANGYRLAGIWQRRLGRIGLADDPAAYAAAHDLGPDALNSEISLKEFKRRLQERRGAIKSALMEQAFLAGIGNIYSDEILFQSGIRPDVKVCDLGDARIHALHRAMRHVLRIAIARQANPDRLPDSWLLPHRYNGGKCPRCGSALQLKRSSGRTAYFCPRCQR